MPSPYDELADKTYRKYDYSVTFQLVPSTYPLDWSSSFNLLYSLAKNRYFFPKTRSMLGHITTEINCKINGKMEREFIGSGPKDLMGFRKYILAGYGFSVLNRPGQNPELPLLTIDGQLDNEKKDFEEFNALISKNNFGTLSVLVNETDCQSALEFARAYKEKTKSTPMAGNRYGFGADPEKYEGAGCAPLAQTLMRKSGLTQLDQKFERPLFVPRELVGNPEKDNLVSLWQLLFKNDKLDTPAPGFLEFHFPDPQLIYDYLISLNDKNPIVLESHFFPGSQCPLKVVRYQ